MKGVGNIILNICFGLHSVNKVVLSSVLQMFNFEHWRLSVVSSKNLRGLSNRNDNVPTLISVASSFDYYTQICYTETQLYCSIINVLLNRELQ